MRNINQNRSKQSGSSLVEILVSLGIFLTLGLGAFQWGLLYETKTAASHASFMAARAGAMEHADVNTMRFAFAKAMAPLYAPESGSDEDIAQVIADQVTDGTALTRVRILNPTQEAFEDFSVDLDDDGRAEEIQNLDLDLASTAVGGASQINIQDANLLKVEFTYGAPLYMPVISDLFTSLLARTKTRPSEAFERALLEAGRFPITTTSTVRMQTYAKLNDAVVSIEEGEENLDNLANPIEYTYNPPEDRLDIFISPSDEDSVLCEG